MPFPQLEGTCERLREAGLAITPRDVFCQPIPWTSHAAYVVGSLLIAVGFVLPGVILAANGHRVTAFLPLLLAPGMTRPQSVILSAPWWPSGSLAATVVALMVMAVPVGAVILATRRSAVLHPRPSVIAGIASAIACGAGVTGLVFAGQGVLTRHYGELVGNVGIAGIVPPAIAIAVFGALLGTDSRWWPWSIAPIAILMSAGPSSALTVGPQRLLDWSQFGIVVPLFFAGLAGSAWRPLALGLARLFPDDDAPWESPPPRRERRRSDPARIRPVVALNAVAIGLLAVSLIAFRADPLPAQMSASLPTYLGARVLVQNLRTKLDLRQVITTMDAYRDEHGTYKGFDGESSLPAAVDVVSATDRVARVTGVSESGTAFCLERSGGRLAFGSGTGDGPADATGSIEQAEASCGSTAWTAAEVRPFPITTMCEGLDASGGYLICRMVQALMTETMRWP